MIYAYGELTITNPDAFAEYAKVAGQALAKHGGKPVAATTEPAVLDGTPALPTRAIILSFPDRAAALAWINDPELADAHALRRSAGSSDFVLLG